MGTYRVNFRVVLSPDLPQWVHVLAGAPDEAITIAKERTKEQARARGGYSVIEAVLQHKD